MFDLCGVCSQQSNRKTPSVIGFDPLSGDRVLGEAALSLSYRSPARAFPQIKRLLGKRKTAAEVTSYTADFPAFHEIVASARGGVGFKLKERETEASIEELFVMLLEHARQITEQHSKALSGSFSCVV